MSLELYTFLDVLPDQQSWQVAIDRSGVDLKFDPDLDLRSDQGFSPCQLAGRASGFEIYVTPTSEIVGELPSAASVAGTRPHALTFRWGGPRGQLPARSYLRGQNSEGSQAC